MVVVVAIAVVVGTVDGGVAGVVTVGGTDVDWGALGLSFGGAVVVVVSLEPPHPVRPNTRIAVARTLGAIIFEPLASGYRRIDTVDRGINPIGAEAAAIEAQS